MPASALSNLGTMVRKKRGNRGLRDTAAEIGTSAPTLSRIESGRMPDLQTFGKLCSWLEIDPATLLGIETQRQTISQPNATFAHLRAKREIEAQTVAALSRAIVQAQRMLVTSSGESDGERL